MIFPKKNKYRKMRVVFGPTYFRFLSYFEVKVGANTILKKI